MSEPLSDDELRDLFARQRAADREATPLFHAMRTLNLRARRTSESAASVSCRRWVLASAAAAVLAVAALLAIQRPSSLPRPQPDRLAQQLDAIDAVMQKSLREQHDLSAWQSSTDFLLPPIQHLDRP